MAWWHDESRIALKSLSVSTDLRSMRFCSRSLSAVLGFAALALSPSAGSAAATLPNTANILVTATVLNACTVTAVPLVFGGYTLTNQQAATAESAVTTVCTNLTPVVISMNAGSNAPASTFNRSMVQTGGSTLLPYQIFTDSGYTTVWGDGTANSTTVKTTGTGLAVVTPVYGQIPKNENVPAGLYTDTVVVTIAY
jgi:spore coat protein U-like protein